MPVLTAADVDQAAVAGIGRIPAGPGTVVTPAARDRARERGIAIGDETLPSIPAWQARPAPAPPSSQTLTGPVAAPSGPLIVPGSPPWRGKPFVKFLDTTDLPWRRGGPGRYFKRINDDPTTGERTSLTWVIPSEGYTPPSTAHFHTTYEEILIVHGMLSFNSRDWLPRLAYCWHAPRTVHGFKSAVPDHTIFLARVGRALDTNLIDQPIQTEPYNLDGPIEQMSRPFCYVQGASPDGWVDVRDEAGNLRMQRKVLSVDRSTGEGSMLVRFMPGFKSPHGRRYHTVFEESYVLEGALIGDDGTAYMPGCYRFQPPFHVYGPSSSPDGALVYINFGGKLDFRPFQ